MARSSRAIEELSPAAKAQLARLGANIDAAIRTRETYSSFADRVGITRLTLRKLINGEPGIPLGILVAVLDALGLIDQLSSVAAPEHDSLGQSLRLYGQKQKPDTGKHMSNDF